LVHLDVSDGVSEVDWMMWVEPSVAVEERAGEVCASDKRKWGETHIIDPISSDPVKALEENQKAIHHSESS